ncbi:DUF2510 domain-containing protein [Streptomyces sp. 3214.6]|uniref:DUF2510 domain-containing protein n=1 Tax=Streptomyces sp. 3214.6 TaxID=1882757 RepID=UPI00090A594D|nr:DUF2510 domain-containing protein [Streptomyces sp. 3214.6]SHH69112.1 Protein of unknown function [Streptomyces sp. 3214.6]
MTQVTPPGWYPDPGQTSDGPATERWWDGKTWTDQTRAVGSAAVWGPPAQTSTDGTYSAQPGHPGYPTYPGYSGYPGQPGAPAGAGQRRGLRTGIAVAAAVAVLASIGVGVYALAKDDSSGGGGGTAQGPGGQGGPGGNGGPFGGPGGSGGSGGSGGASPSPGESEAPKIKSGAVTDALNGISIPIPKGWTGQELSVGAQITSDSSYKCPGDTSKTCTKGGVYSAPVEALETKGGTAEQVAKADIAANAEESYGGKTYGSITSHQVLASEAVTVAGQKGYLVRWKAVTSKGADGVVESLAFPAPADTKRLVVLRFGVDADQSLTVIDTITQGIKVAKGGGSGHDV